MASARGGAQTCAACGGHPAVYEKSDASLAVCALPDCLAWARTLPTGALVLNAAQLGGSASDADLFGLDSSSGVEDVGGGGGAGGGGGGAGGGGGGGGDEDDLLEQDMEEAVDASPSPEWRRTQFTESFILVFTVTLSDEPRTPFEKYGEKNLALKTFTMEPIGAVVDVAGLANTPALSALAQALRDRDSALWPVKGTGPPKKIPKDATDGSFTVYAKFFKDNFKPYKKGPKGFKTKVVEYFTTRLGFEDTPAKREALFTMLRGYTALWSSLLPTLLKARAETGLYILKDTDGAADLYRAITRQRGAPAEGKAKGKGKEKVKGKEKGKRRPPASSDSDDEEEEEEGEDEDDSDSSDTKRNKARAKRKQEGREKMEKINFPREAEAEAGRRRQEAAEAKRQVVAADKVRRQNTIQID